MKKRLCKCGCKKRIIWKNYYKYYGIPKFISGHNTRKKQPTKKPKIMPLCKCGCKKRIIWKKHYKYLEIPGYIGGHSNKNKTKANISKSYLEDLYLNQKLSQDKIAKRLGVKQSTVHGYLKRFNIKLRSKSESEKLKYISGNYISHRKGKSPWNKGKIFTPLKIKKQNKRKRSKKYYHNNKDKILKKHKERKINDPNYALKGRLRGLLWHSLKNYTKTGKIMASRKYGINYQAIIEHLKPFPNDISKYHIDHIRPLCSFNLTKKSEIKKAFAPKNHQWLLVKENLKKNGKTITI